MRKPTPKQQVAIDQLVKDPSLKVCAEVTGYSYGYLRQLVTKPNIVEALEEARKEVTIQAQELAVIDKAFILTGAKELFDRCMQHTPVLEKVDGEWVPTGEYKFEHTGAAKALEIMGKHVNVRAFGKDGEGDGQPPLLPADMNWTVTIVHTTKEEYDRNQKPPIEHRS